MTLTAHKEMVDAAVADFGTAAFELIRELNIKLREAHEENEELRREVELLRLHLRVSREPVER
jgi:hypothetical protein